MGLSKMEKKYLKDKVLTTIYPYIKDKEVLDIGCIEHDLERKDKERIWVHDFLRQNAKHVVGIDILKKDIETLKKQGYDVYCQNAETFKLNKKFDVIFAGELIEHLSNPGLFLEKCKLHLKKDGFLILTTPNAFTLSRILEEIIFFTNDPTVNPEHTLWYSPTVIKELLRRYDININKIYFVDYPNIKPKVTTRIISLICDIFGNKFRETMIIIAK